MRNMVIMKLKLLMWLVTKVFLFVEVFDLLEC